MILPLSILDLAPVSTDSSGSTALHNSIALAQAADRMGYTRYWLAEHHNIPSIAISSPEILIGIIAHQTERIRVGSGGVMLPNHSPLSVAESFRTLEALYPGRIDLGIGRAPGTDPLTAFALRQSRERLQINDFPEQLLYLMAFGRGNLDGSDFPADHPFRAIRPIPVDSSLPPICLLGSSREFSAKLAADHGMAFAFAYHINPTLADLQYAVQTYRAHFQPNIMHPEPHAMVAVGVLCCETTEEAEELATILDLSFVRRQRGELKPLPTLEEALSYSFSPVEQAQAQQYRQRQIIGDPVTVRDGILTLAEQSDVAEVFAMTILSDYGARLRSYELLAETFELTSQQDDLVHNLAVPVNGNGRGGG